MIREDIKRKDLYIKIYDASYFKRMDHFYADSDAKQAVEAYDKFFNNEFSPEPKPAPTPVVDLDEEIPF